MRRSPLVRKAELRPKRGRDTGPSPSTVEAVYERAGWACERRGEAVGPQRGVDHHLHHRRPRQRGGSRLEDTNLSPNIVVLCPACHALTEARRADAYRLGWLVHSWEDPAVVPVWLHDGRRVFLATDGRYSYSSPSPEVDGG